MLIGTVLLHPLDINAATSSESQPADTGLALSEPICPLHQASFDVVFTGAALYV